MRLAVSAITCASVWALNIFIYFYLNYLIFAVFSSRNDGWRTNTVAGAQGASARSRSAQDVDDESCRTSHWTCTPAYCIL